MKLVRIVSLSLLLAACGSDDSDNTNDGSGDNADGSGDSADGSGDSADGSADGSSDGSGDSADGAADGSSDGSGDSADGSADGSGDGAGDGDGSGVDGSSCAERSCNVPALYTCYQWTGDEQNNASFCEQLGGSPTDGPCPTEDQVGGCQQPSPFGGDGCAVNWGYGPVVGAEDVQADCDAQGGEFIAR